MKITRRSSPFSEVRIWQSSVSGPTSQQGVDELLRLGVVVATSVGGAERRDVVAGVQREVVRVPALAFLRLGEPAVEDAAAEAGIRGLVAEERLGQRGLPERGAEVVDDLRRGVEPAEHADERRRDVAGPRGARRRDVAREPVQVVTLDGAQAQRAGERRDGLGRRAGAASLLEAGVEVRRHVGERGDLLATQAGGTAPTRRRQTDVVGLQRLAAPAEEIGETVAIHLRDMVAGAGRGSQGQRVHG